MLPADIPTKDYGRQYKSLWSELRPVIRRTLLESDPILGDPVAIFERALAKYHHVRQAIGVNSGTSALVLALQGTGIGRGDEVITCAHTFAGVITAIVLAGADPVLVDADDETGLLSVDGTASAVGPRTRAILAVHLYGHPVDLDGLTDLAHRAEITLLEDAAQAHGATWRGRPLGSFGRAAALSFHPSKNLGAFGDGGAVLTTDESLADRLRVMRNLGKSGKYEFALVSDNSKLDTIQAAILQVKLRHLDSWVARRRGLAARYHAGLHGVGDLRLPAEDPRASHGYHLYVVRTSVRTQLKRFLGDRNIATGLHYPIPAHLQPAHAARFAGQSFPVAARRADEVLSLPLSHEHEDSEIDRTIEAIRAFYGEPALG